MAPANTDGSRLRGVCAAKLRLIVGTFGSLLLLGLAVLAFAVGGWRLTDDAVADFGYTILLFAAGILFMVVADLISPFGATARKGGKQEGEEESGWSGVAQRPAHNAGLTFANSDALVLEETDP